MTQTTTSTSTERLHADGYFLVEGLLDDAECERHARRLQEYAAGYRIADGVKPQREPAVERSGKVADDGSDVRKVSGLYHDPLFRALIQHPRIIGHMRDLVGAPVRLFRADALMKPAAVGSAKGVHQDSPYWPVAPMSLWSCWIPFDDATEDNGCLTVVPGSHRTGPAPHESVQDDFVIPSEHHAADDLITVPMRRGTGLFFHSLLVHGSAANTSGDPRRAVTMSYLGPDHHATTSTGAEESWPTVG